jgi:uncharacterized protein YjaG (DUF416 family)
MLLENLKTHMEMLLTDEMRSHRTVSEDYDLHFQVYRVLSGYHDALEEIKKLKKRVKELDSEKVSD